MSRKLTKYLSRKIRFISVFAMAAVIFVNAFNFETELTPTTRLNGNNFAFVFEYFFSNELFSFAVPLFFIISGFLFFHNYENSVNGYATKLKHRAFSLLVPYVVWAALSGLLIVALSQVELLKNLPEIQKYSEPLPNFFVYFINPPAEPLWFIRQLMLYSILSPLLYFLIKNLKGIILVIFCALWAFNLNYIIDCSGLFFFSVGASLALLSDFNVVAKKQNNKIMALCFGAGWILLSVLNTFIATKSDDGIAFKIVLNELYKLNEVVGVIAMWLLFDHIAKRITDKRGFIIAATHLFFVYAMHQPITNILNQIAFSQEGSDTYIGRLAIYICLPISIAAVCIITGMAIKRNCRPLHSIMTGGRGQR